MTAQDFDDVRLGWLELAGLRAQEAVAPAGELEQLAGAYVRLFLDRRPVAGRIVGLCIERSVVVEESLGRLWDLGFCGWVFRGQRAPRKVSAACRLGRPCS